MERLTDECWKNLDPWECCGQDKFCTRGCHDKGGCTNGCIVPKVYCRLAKYEDIGLTPEQIREVDKLYTEKCEELAKYKKLKEQGVLLPCKVGDTVYLKACCECICASEDIMTGIKECPFECDCEFEECSNGNERMFKTSIRSIWNNGVGWYFTVRGLDLEIPITDIGRTVFLNEDDVKTKECWE